MKKYFRVTPTIAAVLLVAGMLSGCVPEASVNVPVTPTLTVQDVATSTDVAVVVDSAPTTTEPIDTSGWKTYRNEEYGFEFRYPEHYVIEPSDGVLVLLTNMNTRESCLGPGVRQRQEYYDKIAVSAQGGVSEASFVQFVTTQINDRIFSYRFEASDASDDRVNRYAINNHGSALGLTTNYARLIYGRERMLGVFLSLKTLCADSPEFRAVIDAVSGTVNI